ncbi:MAG: tetratricopeptide repeat protein [Bacteroidota bacterium]
MADPNNKYQKLIAAGNQLLELKRFDLAEKKFQAAIGILPERHEAYNCVANANMQNGRLQKAEKFAEKALALNPDNSFSYFIIGTCAADCQKLKKGEIYLKKAIETDSHIPHYWSVLGHIYLLLDEKEKSEEHLIKALEINPNHGRALNLLALNYFFSDKMDLAKEYIEKALALQPENEFHQLTAGRILGNNSSQERSVQHFKNAIKVNPNSNYNRQAYIDSKISAHWWWGDFYPPKLIQTETHYFNVYVSIAFAFLWFTFLFKSFSLVDIPFDGLSIIILLMAVPFAAIYSILPTFLKIWNSYKEWGWHGISFSFSMLNVLLILCIWILIYQGLYAQNSNLCYIAFALTLAGAGIALIPIRNRQKTGAVVILFFLLFSPMILISILIYIKSISPFWSIALVAYIIICALTFYRNKNRYQLI